jgi:hypothetical protein
MDPPIEPFIEPLIEQGQSPAHSQLPYPSRTLTRIEAMAPELQLPVHVHTGPLQFRMQSELASIRINFCACSVDLPGK